MLQDVNPIGRGCMKVQDTAFLASGRAGRPAVKLDDILGASSLLE